ncbi:MAG: cobyric acid synthase [Planctomycetota bacterium]
MVMGTCSSAGKSLIVTALCRCLARRGLRVAPFKSQNMSNNAAVCASGGEIGRSQALQAIAAGVDAETDMNPVLLKPEGDTRSQVVVNGEATPALEARQYFAQRRRLWPLITAALDRLQTKFEMVVIEGAGSPAELNLADVEMVNLAIARHCQAPTILVGDIERGGVFAQLLGTLWLIPEQDRQLFCGMLVNKFRGDRSLFDTGIDILQERSDVPVLGVLPWIKDLHLPEEDSVSLNPSTSNANGIAACDAGEVLATQGQLDCVVVQLPHIANFDDFDPLNEEPGVRLRYVQSASDIGNPDVLILPGTKNTIRDLHWLGEVGLADRIKELASLGTQLVGICGGYQMLGRAIENPKRFESDEVYCEGLGLLDTVTCYQPTKLTRQVRFSIRDDMIAPGTLGQGVSGYEIHIGTTASKSAWLTARSNPAREHSETVQQDLDGAHARDGRIWGCYVHGLFANDNFRQAFLVKQGLDRNVLLARSSQSRLQESLDRLADEFEKSVDVSGLLETVMQRSRMEGASRAC